MRYTIRKWIFQIAAENQNSIVLWNPIELMHVRSLVLVICLLQGKRKLKSPLSALRQTHIFKAQVSGMQFPFIGLPEYDRWSVCFWYLMRERKRLTESMIVKMAWRDMHSCNGGLIHSAQFAGCISMCPVASFAVIAYNHIHWNDCIFLLSREALAKYYL